MRIPHGLPEDVVHVWYVRSDEVRDPATFRRYAAMMTPEERTRHDRFVRDRDRHLFLVTRGTIRSLIARYLGVDPAESVFRPDSYGRPFLSHPADAALSFNISHTKGLVACAIAREPEIGVDVEDTERPARLHLVRRFFSPEEADALDALPDGDKAGRFYEYWTLKESYIKARGMGMWLPLDGFSMQLEDGRQPGIRFAPSVPDDPASWQFGQFRPTSRHCLALAVRRRGRDRDVLVREFVPSSI
jgi:4'-phosphopantetheinyl transferase